mmetsp:Transcript_30141/g.70321  ORF Transcript_30141/g.70321 Transcript_30141/m.70321 type:complete len:863 (-) Transcript_30141:200-2788(-)
MVAAAPVARPESGSVEAEETWNTASDALNAAEESCQVLEQKYLPDLPGQTPAPPQSPPPDAEGNATDRDTEEGGNEIYLLQRAFLDAPLPVEESGSLTSDSKSSSKLLGLAGVNPESERESGTLDREPSPAKKADPHELAAAVNADRAGRRKSLFGDWLQGAKQRRQSVKSVKSSADGTPKQPETRRKSMFWGVDQGLNFFSRGNTLAGQDGADGGKRRNSGEATDSGATGRFVHKDVQAHLLQLQEMFKKEAEEERKRKQRELARQAQKEKGVRSLVGSSGAWNDYEVRLGTGCRYKVHRLLQWMWFDFIIGLVITANAVTIGAEAAMEAEGTEAEAQTILRILESSFLFVYSVELGLRFYAYGLLAIKNNWIKFDVFLVVTGFIEFALNFFVNDDRLDQITMVRLLRFSRLARVVRFLSQFRVLWALVQGMSHSLTTLVWTFFLIFSMLYTFAILGNDLIEDEALTGDEANRTRMAAYNAAAENFNGLTKSMLTLAQFLTFDTVSEIYRPLIVEKPWLVLYFIVFVLLCSVALMNLVIAVMVENHMEQNRSDKIAEKARQDKRKQKLLPQLRKLFKDLDTDGSGDIEWTEIETADDQTKQYLQEIGKGLDLEELFRMLDYDMCGTLDVDEFCDGLIKAATSDKPLELLRLVSMCSDTLITVRHALDLSQDVTHKMSVGPKPERRYGRNPMMMKLGKIGTSSMSSAKGTYSTSTAGNSKTMESTTALRLLNGSHPGGSSSFAARATEETSPGGEKGPPPPAPPGDRPCHRSSAAAPAEVMQIASDLNNVVHRLDGMDSRMESLEQGIERLLAFHCGGPTPGSHAPVDGFDRGLSQSGPVSEEELRVSEEQRMSVVSTLPAV